MNAADYMRASRTAITAAAIFTMAGICCLILQNASLCIAFACMSTFAAFFSATMRENSRRIRKP